MSNREEESARGCVVAMLLMLCQAAFATLFSAVLIAAVDRLIAGTTPREEHFWVFLLVMSVLGMLVVGYWIGSSIRSRTK